MTVDELRRALTALEVPWRWRQRKPELEQLLQDAEAHLATADSAGQLELDIGQRALGPVEQGAANDLLLLAELGVIPSGSSALERTYRRLARQIDSATAESDRYGVINAARELRAMRSELGVTTGAAGDDALERAFNLILDRVFADPPT